MRLERHTVIEEWTESNLSSLPDGETDYYEYKSSQITIERLKKEISVAASAFWNSGGGIFIVGADDDGQIDGGIFDKVGSQRLRDWADQVLAHVEPLGPYSIATIEPETAESPIRDGHVVLVIAFGESPNAPHMAPDYRYYVRAGTHSLPAGHFLVEAIRTRRGLNKPFLRGVLQQNTNKTNIVELVVLAANDAVALDVRLSFDPLPKSFEGAEAFFPLHIPIIDRSNPFVLDVGKAFEIKQTFGQAPIYLELAYQDMAERPFRDRQLLDPTRNLSPVKMGSEDTAIIKKSLQDIVRQMKRLNRYMEDQVNNQRRQS